MKHHKILLALLLMPSVLFLLFSTCVLTAFASEPQNMLAEQIAKELDVEVFFQKEEDPLIKCFDVNDSGYYAIGSNNNTIQVFDSHGIFQYGYRFQNDGTYGIVLKENSIVIYLGRSNIAVEIDLTGECVSAETVYFSKDIVDNVMNRTSKQFETVSYYLERDIGAFHGDYSRLVKIDENEMRIVLYDVTTKGYFAGIFHYIILSIFPIASISLIALKVKKDKNGGNR